LKLEGQVAIVTGAGQGIGRAVALALAREGCNVVVNDTNLSSAQQVAAEVEALGRRSRAIQADVSSAKEVEEMVDTAIRDFKKIDILVNNAGVDRLIPVLEMTEAQWDSMIDVNLKGTFLCSRVVGRQMVKQNGGRIINIASIAGSVAMPGQAAYGASKGGVLQLNRVLAVEWAKYNIYVNAVSPGATLTPMVEKILKEHPELNKNYMGRVPLKKFASPEDIADAVLFLASAGSRDITGQEITVDGGIRALHPGFVEPPSQ